MYRSQAKRGWQMQEMFTWKQFIWVVLVLERKQTFCVITEIMVTDRQKCRRTIRQRMRPWRSRQRVRVFLVLERKQTFCVITEIMVTDRQKCRRTIRQRMRPWRSRQRVSLIILRSWVRASLVAVQEELFYLLYIQLYKFTKKNTNKKYSQLKLLEPK